MRSSSRSSAPAGPTSPVSLGREMGTETVFGTLQIGDRGTRTGPKELGVRRRAHIALPNHRLVWRFRSSHHFRGKSEMRTSEPKPH